MDNKLSPLAFGIAAAVTSAVMSALCAIGFVLWPDATLDFFSALMHGIDLKGMKASGPISLARVIYGVVGLAVIGFVAGIVLAAVYNAVARR